MHFIIEKSFAKSAKSLPKDVQLTILNFIKEIEAADQIASLNNIKKLKTNKKDERECCRYKTGNYRLWFILEKDNLVWFVIADHRKIFIRAFLKFVQYIFYASFTV